MAKTGLFANHHSGHLAAQSMARSRPQWGQGWPAMAGDETGPASGPLCRR